MELAHIRRTRCLLARDLTTFTRSLYLTAMELAHSMRRGGLLAHDLTTFTMSLSYLLARDLTTFTRSLGGLLVRDLTTISRPPYLTAMERVHPMRTGGLLARDLTTFTRSLTVPHRNGACPSDEDRLSACSRPNYLHQVTGSSQARESEDRAFKGRQMEQSQRECGRPQAPHPVNSKEQLGRPDIVTYSTS